MDNYDIMCFLEFYQDRANVIDPVSGLRTPTRQWQNFYQVPQPLSIDAGITGTFGYLAFDVDGFGSVEAGSVNDLSISVAAVAEVEGLTEVAMVLGTSFVVASLVIQQAGHDSFYAPSAQIVSRYAGGLHTASVDEISISWTVNPSINKTKAQVPTKKISSNMLSKFEGQ